MEKTTFYDFQNNLCSDSCWLDYKNTGNEKIMNYTTYDKSSQLLPCNEPKVRVPEFMLDHPNLRGRAGYGLAEPCLVDIYNDLVKNDEMMTREMMEIGWAAVMGRLAFRVIVIVMVIGRPPSFVNV